MTSLFVTCASIVLLVLLAYTNAAPTIDPSTEDEVKVTSITENPEDTPPLVTDLPDGKDPSDIIADSVASADKESGDIPDKSSENAPESTTDVQEDEESATTDSSTDSDAITEEIPQAEDEVDKTVVLLQQSELVADTVVSQETISDVDNFKNDTISSETLEATSENPENDKESDVQLNKDQIAKINKADDSDNEILNQTELDGKLSKTKETSGKLKIVSMEHDEGDGKTSDKVEIVIEPSSKEELKPQNAVDVTIYNIETNNQDTLDIEIKPLKTEMGSQETNSTAEGSGSKISDEVFDTMLYVNASGEAVTTRYFSSEETNSTELQSVEDHFNLTTMEPVFSDEKSELQELRVENLNMTASNESMSSEAILTKFHEEIHSEEPSGEVVTTRYFSVESGMLESFEDDRNKTQESMERMNLTTINPLLDSSESVEHVVMIKKYEGPKSRKIILVANSGETESIEETAHEFNHGDADENVHVLQAKPEEMIPIHGITSEEAFKLIEKSEKKKAESGEVISSHEDKDGSAHDENIEVGLEDGPSTELNFGTTDDSTIADYDEFGVETVQPIFSDENQIGEMREEKTADEPSLDGQVLGLVRGMIFNLR